MDGLHAGQSKSRGGPNSARRSWQLPVASASVVARHCRGNGSGAVGRDTSWPTMNAMSSAAGDGFAKSATQTPATLSVLWCKSRARRPSYTCTYMFAGTPWRFVAVKGGLLKHKKFPSFIINVWSFASGFAWSIGCRPVKFYTVVKQSLSKGPDKASMAEGGLQLAACKRGWRVEATRKG